MSDLFSINSLPGCADYSVEEEIGHGTYSVWELHSPMDAEVYRARHQTSGQIVALKHILFSDRNVRPIHLRREIYALSLLKTSKNVINLCGLYEQEWSASLMLDHWPINLARILERKKGTKLPEAFVKTVMMGVLKALRDVHAAGIVHRDVSPSNILIDLDGAVCLSDFGQARVLHSMNKENMHDCCHFQEGREDLNLERNDTSMQKDEVMEKNDMTPAVGTQWYRAPELLFGSKTYGFSVDMWSVGCVFAELLRNEPIFPGSGDIGQICCIRNILGNPSQECWPGVVDLPDWGKLVFPPKTPSDWSQVIPNVDSNALNLVEQLLRYNPSGRISAEEALTSDYLVSSLAPSEIDKKTDECLTTFISSCI